VKYLWKMYAIMLDGTCSLLWAEVLPADWDWQAWTASRAEAKRVLGVAYFRIERQEI